MSKPDDLETLMASESIKHANLQELARLVLAYSESRGAIQSGEAFENMINFAKGVAQ